jgi:CheY-like chemotaxis protein
MASGCLLVDAEPQIRDMVADTLRLRRACHGRRFRRSGLASLKRKKPDALLSSISMPDRDGYWLIREVRKLSRDQGGDVPAAAFTGLTAPEDRLACLRAGFQYHVPKPVAMSRLAGVVALMALKNHEVNGHRTMIASSPKPTITTTELITKARSSRTDLARSWPRPTATSLQF